MDCDFTREQEPWEATDGCVYLMRELAATHPALVAELLPTLAESAREHEFPDHHHLLENIWNQLSTIAERVGKKTFKAHLQAFIAPLYYSLTSDNQLARVAGEQFTVSAAKLIGTTIFNSRVELEDPGFGDVFQRVLTSDGDMGGMPGGAGMGSMVGSFPGVRVGGK